MEVSEGQRRRPTMQSDGFDQAKAVGHWPALPIGLGTAVALRAEVVSPARWLTTQLAL